MKKFLALVFLITSFSGFAGEIDYEAIGKQLEGNGLTVYIHAASHEIKLYVATWRNPKDFFNSPNLPILSGSAQVAKIFKTLNRHDKALLKGKLKKSEAPIPHIEVSSIEVLELAKNATHHTYEAKLPEDLKNKTEAIFKVHAIVEGGKALAVEYKDAICPLLCKDLELTKGIYRGDKILVKYQIREAPNRPVHLEVDEKAKTPLKVLKAIKELNEKEMREEGILVKYPKSPAVSIDTYAIEVTDADGIKIDFSLFSEKDGPAIKKVIAKWKENEKDIVKVRNKFALPKIKLKVRGIVSVTDANQTPMIILEENDIEFLK